MIWWPHVRSQLVTVLPTLWTSVSVYDGRPVTRDAPSNWCTVGSVDGEPSSGQFSKVEDSVDGMLGENGTIRSELVLKTGDVDLPGLQAQAFALFDAFETYLRSDPYFGVLPTSSTAFYSVDDVPAQLVSGSVLRLPWTLTYFARS